MKHTAIASEPDQSKLSTYWAETNKERAREYRRMATYYRGLASRYEASARHYETVAAADREVVK